MLAFGLAAGATLAPAAAAHAETITVDTLSDDPGAPGTSLREAIEIANGLVADPDKIVFQSGLTGTITLNPASGVEGNSALRIMDTVDIEGPGAGQLTIDGANNSRVLSSSFPYLGLESPHHVEIGLSGVTVTNGRGYGDGGGILIAGNVDFTLEDSVVTNNTAWEPYDDFNATGGGILAFGAFQNGHIVIRDTVISGNDLDSSTYATGGGLYAFAEKSLTIENSVINGNEVDASDPTGGGGLGWAMFDFPVTIDNTTISGNTTSGDGGGVYGFSGDLEMTNSTVAGNSADGAGGGMSIRRNTSYGEGTATLRNVTVAGNDAGGNGGGLLRNSQQAKPSLINTIVGDNTSGGTLQDVQGGFRGSFSLLESAPTTGNNAFIDDVTGSTIIGQDPQLGPLQNNGGTTQTKKPAQTSPAIDKGISTGGPALDQRGEARPFDVPSFPNSAALGANGADIGAVELNASETPSGGGGNLPPTVDFDYSPADPETGEVVTFTADVADSDGEVESLEWDLDGDGQFDDGTTSPITRSYPDVGSIEVTLRATDDDDAPAQITKTFVVTAGPVNQPPVAEFDFAPATPKVGEAVTFTSTSSDPDGSLSGVAWDLDGDGQFDDSTAASVSHSFATAGEHPVALRATDNGSPAQSTDTSRSVPVVPAPPPGGGAPVVKPGEGNAFAYVTALRKCKKKKKKKARKKCKRKAKKLLGRTAAVRREFSFIPPRVLNRVLPRP
jgi:hypothetical protein